MNSAQILERLVGFATVSRDSNLALIEYVREFLADCGASSKIYLDTQGRKANLYASIGPVGQPGILLSLARLVEGRDGLVSHSGPHLMVDDPGRRRFREISAPDLTP